MALLFQINRRGEVVKSVKMQRVFGRSIPAKPFDPDQTSGKKRIGFVRSIIFLTLFGTLGHSAVALEPLRYNNPGLVVDLGVGLWAGPLPLDFDGDGDLDLVVSCPDKPYNGLYFFENADGDTATHKFPIFKPARRIGKGLHNTQLCVVDGRPYVLTPAAEYPDFRVSGFDKPKPLPLPANIHKNNVRGNFWSYVDFDGDGKLDVVVGADDWKDYGWDNAYDANGRWTRGPLRGFVYVVRNTGTNERPAYAQPLQVAAGERPLETFGWPSPNFHDFDRDGDLDLICGEFLDGFTYFENVGTRNEPNYANGRRLKTRDGMPIAMDLEMITPTAIDWDKDGDVDLIVGDEDGRVALLENSGTIGADRTPIFQRPRYFQQEADLLKFGALATPVGIDWDNDGDVDIVSGNTAGYIGILENLSGKGVESPRWAAPKRVEADGKVIRVMAGSNGSIQGPAEAKWGYTALSVADWDGDGLLDLIVNSIWGKVVWYHNVGTRSAPDFSAAESVDVEWNGAQPALSYGWLRPTGKALLTQWRTTPVAVDWNHDGLTDLVMLDHEGYLAYFERARHDGRLVLLAPRRAFAHSRHRRSAPLERQARRRERASETVHRRLGRGWPARPPRKRGQRHRFPTNRAPRRPLGVCGSWPARREKH